MIEGEGNGHANGEGQGGEERGGEASEMDGWTDKRETTAAEQRTRIPCKTGVKGNRFGSEGLKRTQTKGETGRMEVEDSGCQDCRWDGVRSHFSSVIVLSASPPLSSLSNYRHNEAGPFLQSCIWLL